MITRTGLSPCLVLAATLQSGILAADSDTLAAAVKQYYAGQPQEAIAMIEPLATAGDVNAQYLLGNILYTLSQAQQAEGDPARWYRMAAEQGSAPASFALGTLYQNRWLQSRREEDADQAQAYYHQAVELGDAKAQVALDKLSSHRRSLAANTSLTYTNKSFSSTREPPQATQAASRVSKPEQAPQRETLNDALANFQPSGDPLADAQRLQQLINETQYGVATTEAGEAADDAPSLSALMQLLGGLQSTEVLLKDLSKLYEHIQTATELSTAPGAK